MEIIINCDVVRLEYDESQFKNKLDVKMYQISCHMIMIFTLNL